MLSPVFLVYVFFLVLFLRAIAAVIPKAAGIFTPGSEHIQLVSHGFRDPCTSVSHRGTNRRQT